MLKRGSVVLSRAGKDTGTVLAVVGTGSDGRILTADGGRRPLEKPKAKNARHLSETGAALTEGEMATNRELRRALARTERERQQSRP